MASTFLSKSISSTGNKQKMTFSAWVKRSGSATGCLFATGVGGERSMILIESGGNFQFSRYNSSYIWHLNTTRKLRDPNAWYHIVCAFDTTQSTASNRVKIYINGVQETSFGTSTYPSINYEDGFNTAGKTQYVGQDSDGNQDFDGIMSHVHYVDGTAYPASTFGSTDALTGEWKINTNPTVTYGTNGFFLFKNDNAVTDRSGQGNNFAVGAGTLTKSEDNPSNIFCTMNPLMNYSNGTPLFNLGNNRIRGGGSAWLKSIGTLANRTGKFYYEAKLNNYYGSGRPVRLGWDSIDFPHTGGTTYYSGFNVSTDGFVRGGIKGHGSYDPNAVASGTTYGAGDFIGFAIDLDNDLISVYKNGTVMSGVNGFDISGNTNCSVKKSYGYQVSPSCNWYAINDSDNIIDFNFGNGVFGDTQLTGTTYNDSQGNGIFKYQPPTNYLAWCTKSFNV